MPCTIRNHKISIRNIRNNRIKIFILLAGCLVCFLVIQPDLSATQKEVSSSGLAVFSNQKRPVPAFDHDKHEQALEENGCGACHHVFDTQKNRLVYEEGEETTCSECHMGKTQENVLSFREASHASCTRCHRRLKKADKAAGPTTCGECHKK